MSALPIRSATLEGMRSSDIAEVLAVEQRAYPVPWSHGNFIDSLAAGYAAFVLRGADRALLGYFLAMQGVDEMHLLNITVAPGHQGQGMARRLLDEVCELCRRRGCSQLWLEVRLSNQRARAVYARYGFAEVGQRRGYYPPLEPAVSGLREDAVLMSLAVGS
ncbi:ribosomal protein S18-alanine N-acetyltransferase [soil metagenome]